MKNSVDDWEKPFYSFKTSWDLLGKARRELERYEAEPSDDHAFNFFVTVYHIRDWAKADSISIEELDKDPDFNLCRLACNHGKHHRLNKEPTLGQAIDRDYAPHSDIAFFDTERYAVQADGNRLDVATLGHRVLNMIEAFLGEYGNRKRT